MFKKKKKKKRIRVVARSQWRLPFPQEEHFLLSDVPRDSGRAKTLYRAGVALQKNVPIVLEMTTSVSASWHFVINLLLSV
jgi:hypothetical protein